MREDYGKEITIKFAHNGSGRFQQGYKVHVYSYENSYIKVDQVVELREDYIATVQAQYMMTQQQMMETLPRDENQKVFLQAEPAEDMDQLPNLMTRILESPTAVEMINKPEKTVKFHVL